MVASYADVLRLLRLGTRDKCKNFCVGGYQDGGLVELSDRNLRCHGKIGDCKQYKDSWDIPFMI